MKPVLSSSRRAGRCPGFSLLEMLIGMGILSVLILALYSLFDQTQKALRANVNQVDVSEGSRSVMELLVRDVLRARATGLNTNYVYAPGLTNIVATIAPATNLVVLRTTAGLNDDNYLAVFGDGGRRDTMLHELYYLVESQPGQWVGAGLFVGSEDPTTPLIGPGTLYRYEDTDPQLLLGARAEESMAVLYQRFFNNNQYRTNHASRLIDGVLFFRATAFGALGQPLDGTIDRSGTSLLKIPADVIVGPTNRPPFNLNATVFKNRALPTALELELGVLPPQLLDQYRALTANPPGLRYRFLTNNAANVLVFRQRIPLPTAPALLQ